jgi:RHS repeat-associated protein
VFGVHLDGRTEINVSYKFGMHGMERDDELKGAGNSYVTTYRLYDPRLGRWFTLDPESASLCFESNYSFNHNNPNSFVDIDGDFTQMIAGFFIGAATEFTSQFIKNLLKKNDDGERFDFGFAWRQTDWGDVMIAGIAGMFLPGLSGNTIAKNIIKVSSKVVMAWVDMGWFRKKATETDRFHIRFFAGKDFFKRTNLDDGEENDRLFRGKDMKYLGPEIMNLFIGVGMVGFANGVTSKVTKDDFLKDVLTKPLEGSFKGGAYNIYKPISERIKERCEIRAILKSGKNPIIELSRSKTSDIKTGEHAKENISTTATGTESSANNSIKVEGQKRNNEQQE